jgi:molybdate/tungstate transport system ATP-binding protein
MIGLENISLQRGAFGIRDVNLDVKSGRYFFLMGPSGAGKTLILEIIAGLKVPGSGRVLLDGIDITGALPEERNIGFVYQDYSLFPHYTVGKNIAFGMKMQGRTPSDQDKKVHGLLQQFGISHLADRLPPTLSGGEKQRVALARALAIDPSVLLLDEPFAALDPISREECMQGLRALHRDQGITILQVSHSRDEVYSLADEVALIDHGSILQTGSPTEVFSHPETRRAAIITGTENIFEGVVHKTSGGMSTIDVQGVTITVEGNYPPGSTVVICVRAGDIAIDKNGQVSDHPDNTIQGTIASQVITDYTRTLTVKGPLPLIVTLPRKIQEQSAFQNGDSVRLSFSKNHVLVLPVAPAPDNEIKLM